MSQSATLVAQDFYTIEGTVLDKEDLVPLLGVTIIAVEGKTEKHIRGTGTVTNEDGKYLINLPKGAKLQFIYLGYQTITKDINGSAEDLDILMELSVSDLEEAVIVGYREKRRDNLTGEAVVIDGKDLQDIPVQNVMELLQGKVAGLNIQNNNGTPGAAPTMIIRGISNIEIQGEGDDALLTPTSPLFVIDGIPIDDPSTYQYGFEQSGSNISPLSLIPTEDIAEITVLKDASATSLYGSRGAYGVIIIKTKRGESRVPIVSYSTSFYVSTPPKLRDVIVGRDERMARIYQIMQYDTTAVHAMDIINQNSMLSDSLNAYYNNATDWQSYFYRTTYNQSHNINFSGGDEKFNYKANGGYSDQKGIIANTGFTRYTLSMNMGYRPNNKFSISAYVSTSLGENSKGSGNTLAQRGVANAANTTSLLPSPSLYTASNATLSALSVDNENKSVGVSTNVDIGYELFKNLRLSTAIGYSYNTGTEQTFYPGLLNNDYARIYTYNSVGENLYNRSSASYSLTVKENHNFNIYFFQEVSFGKSKYNSISQDGLPNDLIWGPSGYRTRYSGGSSGFGNESRSAGYSTSFSYNYKNKYVFDFSFRTDGSSTTGPDVPWSKSPSMGVRWNFKQEAFLKEWDFLGYGSIRGSWGKSIRPTGNVYNIYGTYTTEDMSYNNQTAISLELYDIPNTHLVPSTNTQWNMGVDLGFFKGRIKTSFSTYYRQSDKNLRRKEIANHNAFLGVNTNETSLVNYGYEMSLGTYLLPPKSEWSWDVSGSAAINHDILASLPGGIRQQFTGGGNTEQPIVNRLGANALSNYLLHYRGVYEDTEDVPVDPLTGLRYRNGGNFSEGRFFRAGDPIWTDVNGDYILDDNDRVIVGNSQPRITGGISTSLRYKSFSFSTSLSFTLKRDIINNAIADRFQSFKDPTSTTALVPIDAYDFYTRDEPSGYYPDPYDFTRYSLYNPFRYDQTLFQEDGSYVKINNASFSYNVKQEFSENFGISSMRLYFSVNNIYTFSNYSGPNPESVSGLGRDSSGGYPNSRSFSLGLNVQF